MMLRSPLPGTDAAKTAGCKCMLGSAYGGADEADLTPVIEYAINPDCEIHTKPKNWLSQPLTKSG